MSHNHGPPLVREAEEHPSFFALMAARRSCKRFTPKPVELDKVLQIVQAAALAPSSGNIQNWTFIIVTDIGTIRGLYHHTLEQEPFLSAMAAIVVCGDINYAHTMYGMRGKRLYTVQNCAAATQNALLAATALGLGSIWIGAFDEDAVTNTFGIPADKYRPQAIILLGYPAMEPEDKETKLLDNIAFFNRFGNRVKRPQLVYYDWATEWQLQAQKFRNQLAWIKWDGARKQGGHGHGGHGGGHGDMHGKGGDAHHGEKKGEGHGEHKEGEKKDDPRLSQLKDLTRKGGGAVGQARSRISDVINSLKKDGHKK